MKIILFFISITAFCFSACKQTAPVADNGLMALDTLVKAENFVKEVDGKQTALFTLKNDSGMVVKITNYGARLVSVLVPDKNGKYADVNVGYINIDGYLTDVPFFGATVGRFANRIAKGRFKIDGKEYKLAINNGVNALHGGLKSFAKVVWDAVQNDDTLTLKYVSADMEEGYPGQLTVTLKYILTNNNELRMLFEATTDKKTILNLTNHSYFNLKGEGEGDILGHVLEIPANEYLDVDTTLIPLGKPAAVVGTPLDFTKPVAIGARIADAFDQLKIGGGYDHCYIVADTSKGLKLAARVTEPESGRVMEVLSTEPGVQFYSGNFLDGTVACKNGKKVILRGAFALEAQHYPDSPNKPDYPSTLLEPGKTFKSEIIFKFLVKK